MDPLVLFDRTYQNILRFKVSVRNILGMHEAKTVEQLLGHVANLGLGHRSVRGFRTGHHVLVELAVLQELRHNVEKLLIVQQFVYPDDVRVASVLEDLQF